MNIGKGRGILLGLTGGLVLVQAGAARAEVALLSPAEQPRTRLDRVEVKVGGSIRAQYFNEMGGRMTAATSIAAMTAARAFGCTSTITSVMI
ncbi:hypothetical protein [uncultured Kushneria sp.]|uniref:hypothetical protein n=1 Tax=uncultured Kushneria sp. TaxID=905033 RepID=UPI002630A38C|nr:hypothetical protein [uncultured Kushneria sp.]